MEVGINKEPSTIEFRLRKKKREEEEKRNQSENINQKMHNLILYTEEGETNVVHVGRVSPGHVFLAYTRIRTYCKRRILRV